jgi:hypothetical protein
MRTAVMSGQLRSDQLVPRLHYAHLMYPACLFSYMPSLHASAHVHCSESDQIIIISIIMHICCTLHVYFSICKRRLCLFFYMSIYIYKKSNVDMQLT